MNISNNKLSQYTPSGYKPDNISNFPLTLDQVLAQPPAPLQELRQNQYIKPIVAGMGLAVAGIMASKYMGLKFQNSPNHSNDTTSGNKDKSDSANNKETGNLLTQLSGIVSGTSNSMRQVGKTAQNLASSVLGKKKL